MGASLTTLAEICIEIYGASSAAVALGVIDGEWVKSGEFNRYLILADASCARAICNVKGLGARRVFLTGSQADIANGALLSAMVGPAESIQFVITGGEHAGSLIATPPRGATLSEQLDMLRMENRNELALTEIEPHYVQDGHTIYHNKAAILAAGASSVSVDAVFAQFTINFSATSSQCPDEYARAIAAAALAVGFGKQGHKTGAVAEFNAMYKDEMAMLGVPSQALGAA